MEKKKAPTTEVQEHIQKLLFFLNKFTIYSHLIDRITENMAQKDKIRAKNRPLQPFTAAAEV